VKEDRSCDFDAPNVNSPWNLTMNTMNNIEKFVTSLVGAGVISLERLAGGANSLVLKAVATNGEVLLVKVYSHDDRDRFGAEFGGLSFLWKHGVRTIPEPVGAEGGQRLAVFRFVNGKRFVPGRVGRDDVMTASSFLKELYTISRKTEAEALPVASEACFSLEAHVDCVKRRLDSLLLAASGDATSWIAKEYLESEFRPHLEAVEGWMRSTAQAWGCDFEESLAQRQRTLSPSDFGFHNAIGRDDGSLVFIDFEYFGWDDPAKMTADFFHQPAVPVPREYGRDFFVDVCRHLEAEAWLPRRFYLVFPLLGLKWCLIMLNEFLAVGVERRSLAEEKINLEAVRRIQLEKSKRKLQIVTAEFQQRAHAAICGVQPV
jgi:hypothetical protein